MDRSGSLSAPASRLARDALLGTLQDLGRTSNIVVVRGVMDALLQIIRGLEIVKKNRDLRNRLAGYVGEIAGVVSNATSSMNDATISSGLSDSIRELQQTLLSIGTDTTNLSKLPKIRQYLSRSVISETLQELTLRIDRALKIFITKAVTRLGTDVAALNSSVTLIDSDGLRRFRRHEIERLGEFHQTGLELVDVNGHRFLAKIYDQSTHNNLSRDRSLFVKIAHSALLQVSGVLDEQVGSSMLLFHCPRPSASLMGPPVTPTDVLQRLVENKESWKIRAVASRMFLDIYHAFKYLSSRGLTAPDDMFLSQLQINENGRFVLVPKDLKRREKTNLPLDVHDRESAAGFVSLALTCVEDSVSTEERIRGYSSFLVGSVQLVLAAFPPHHLPADFMESLPASLFRLLEEPTSLLAEDDGLQHFKDHVRVMRTPAPLLPGDLLYAPTGSIYSKVPRLGRMPRKLGNIAGEFGGDIARNPLWTSLEPDERTSFGDGHEKYTRLTFSAPEEDMIWLSYDRGLGFRQEKAFQHYRLIVSQLAEKHNVKVDQLVLVLEVESSVGFEIEHMTEEASGDLHIFAPEIPTRMPYCSHSPDAKRRFTRMGNEKARGHWEEGDYSVHLTIGEFEIHCMHLELDELEIIEDESDMAAENDNDKSGGESEVQSDYSEMEE